jgi:RNA polymerase sigma factor for flagellar operon FliA
MTAPKNDTRVSTELLHEQMHLVRGIVAQFVRRLPRSVQREDLLAAGTFGLFNALQASGHLRESCPEMFFTYAKIRIRGAILDELRRNDWSPRRRRSAGPTAAAPGGEAKPASVQVVGFDDLSPVALGSVLGEARNDTGAGAWGRRSPEEALADETSAAELRRYVDELPARERAIIQMRYFEDVPSKEVAARLGLSEARVSQLHARATEMLRTRLAGENEKFAVAA